MTLMPSADSDWQIGKSILESSQYMLDHEIAYDITFLVGENKQEVRAHTFILISRSPVFQAMFCGPMAETQKTISIPDIDLESFKLLLRYMYTDQTDLNEFNVAGTLYAAKKYCVHGLMKACKNYLCEQIDTDNACSSLSIAHTFGEEDLYKTIFDYILENGEKCLQSDYFSELNTDCVMKIIEADKMLADELTIWKSLVRWAEMKCQKQNIVINDSNVREAMGDLVFLVRFQDWDPEKFAKCVAANDILRADEIVGFFRFYHNVVDTTCSFCMKPSRRIGYQRCMRIKGMQANQLVHRNGFHSISFLVSVPIVLYGLIMYSFPQSKSQFMVTINLYDASGIRMLSEASTINNFHDEETFDIMLKKATYLKKKQFYRLTLNVEFNSLYNGWTGKGGQASVTVEGTTVAFQTAERGAELQIPGFLFRIA